MKYCPTHIQGISAHPVAAAVRNASAVLKQPVFSSSTQLISKEALFSLLQTTTAVHPAKSEQLNLQKSITILGQPPIRPVTAAAGSTSSVIFSKLPVTAAGGGQLLLAGGGRHLCLRQLLPDGQAIISSGQALPFATGGFSASQFPAKFDVSSQVVKNAATPVKLKNIISKQDPAERNPVVQATLSVENLNNDNQREEVIQAPAEPTSADISGISADDISAGIDVEVLDIEPNILNTSQQDIESGKNA